MASSIEIVDLSHKGIPEDQARRASKWIAKAFAQAPAEPALAIFFGSDPYPDNVEMHEAFWASHLNQAASSGILLGARDTADGEWKGFRVFFPPGNGSKAYKAESGNQNPALGFGKDWQRFLELAGKDRYMARITEWRRLTSATQDELRLDINAFFTTSIIVVDPSYHRRGTGRRLDQTARHMIRSEGGKLFVRCHEYILGFYIAQGYQVLASPVCTIEDVKPFKVHFLRHDCQ